MAVPFVPAHARTRHGHSEAWARDHYAAADRMREALNGRPPGERSRRDYQRVLNAYRNVYYGAPTSTKADPSAVAVAETLVEMGRRFDDNSILKKAIAQYKFLRREYPGSKYRCDALFTIGEIYKDDLNDPEQARAVFQDFLKRYPRNRLAEDAEQAVAELDRQAKAAEKADPKKNSADEESAGRDETTPDPKPTEDNSRGNANSSPAVSSHASDSHAQGVARVTAIRHWSTPDYTRVAIDVETYIKFGSQRISIRTESFLTCATRNWPPLWWARVSMWTMAFSRRFAVAQFKPGRTRVVLEVDDLSDYDAFLLPDPYRLIIDIHGKKSQSARRKHSRDAEMKEAAAMTADVEAPPRAGSSKTDSDPADTATAGANSDQSKSADTTADDLKQDLRAAAGKAPVTTQDVNDEATIHPKDVAGKSGLPDLPRKVNTKAETPAPTKVIVDNDDEDDTTDRPRSTAQLWHAASPPVQLRIAKPEISMSAKPNPPQAVTGP